MNVGALMSVKGPGRFSILPGTLVLEVVRNMGAYNTGFALVIDAQGNLKGVVSERDVMRCLAIQGSIGLERSVDEVMTKNIITCAADADAQSAIKLMGKHKVRHLPVLSAGTIVGIISSRDVFSYLADHASIEEIAHLWMRSVSQ